MAEPELGTNYDAEVKIEFDIGPGKNTIGTRSMVERAEDEEWT